MQAECWTLGICNKYKLSWAGRYIGNRKEVLLDYDFYDYILCYVNKANVCLYRVIFTFLKQSFNESLDFCNRLIDSCLCNMLRTSNLFARSGTGMVIDS